MPPVRLTPRFGEAMALALALHGGQERKGSGVPYLGHLLGTAAMVLHFGGDEDQAIAGLLHDAAEDQGGKPTLRMIETKFGIRVSRIVEGCTDTFQDPKPDWRPRKEAYVARIPYEAPDVLLVSAADKLDNARAIVADLRGALAESPDAAAMLWSRFKGGKSGTLWYYGALVNAYRKTRVGLVVGELAAAVQEMTHLAGVSTG
jgi:GTP pyrophosphokinase